MSVQNIVSYCQRENYSLWLLCCVADTSRVCIFYYEPIDDTMVEGNA